MTRRRQRAAFELTAHACGGGARADCRRRAGARCAARRARHGERARASRDGGRRATPTSARPRRCCTSCSTTRRTIPIRRARATCAPSTRRRCCASMATTRRSSSAVAYCIRVHSFSRGIVPETLEAQGAAGRRSARRHRRHRHRALLRHVADDEATVLRARRSVLPRARAGRQAVGHRSLLSQAACASATGCTRRRRARWRPSASPSCARSSISSSASCREVVEPAVDAAHADARLFGRHRAVVHAELRHHGHAVGGAAIVGAHDGADRLRRTAPRVGQPIGRRAARSRDRRAARRRPAAARPSWRRRSRPAPQQRAQRTDRRWSRRRRRRRDGGRGGDLVAPAAGEQLERGRRARASARAVRTSSIASGCGANSLDAAQPERAQHQRRTRPLVMRRAARRAAA